MTEEELGGSEFVCSMLENCHLNYYQSPVVLTANIFTILIFCNLTSVLINFDSPANLLLQPRWIGNLARIQL